MSRLSWSRRLRKIGSSCKDDSEDDLIVPGFIDGSTSVPCLIRILYFFVTLSNHLFASVKPKAAFKTWIRYIFLYQISRGQDSQDLYWVLPQKVTI